MESDSYKYYWDNDVTLNHCLIKIDSLDDVEKIRINGLNAKELLDKGKIYLRISGNDKKLSKDLYDTFGDIIIEYDNEIIEKIRVAPWKLSNGKETPEDVYSYVSNKVFDDVNSFLSYVVKVMRRDLKSIDNFSYQFLDNFPISYEFLVNLLNHNVKLLENSLLQLYHNGPIHKEINIKQDYNGSNLVLSSLINTSPYNLYTKKYHTHETLLNQMMFQSAYYMKYASKLIEEKLGTDKQLKERVNHIFRSSDSLMNKYDLWSFFTLEVLDDSQIKQKLLSQNNKFYVDIYNVFRVVKDIIIYINFIAALSLDKGVEMALNEFYTIYEIWSIAKICENFEKNGFVLEEVETGSFNLISAKMCLKLRKNDVVANVIWEIKLDARTHSTYYGGLISEISDSGLNTMIKPDITIMIESDNVKKAFIGDVKFTLKESYIPKLESLYKVLSYLEDLKGSPLFKGYDVEGLLVYPGNMSFVKTPPIENENYINITPVNMFEQNFDKIMEF
ncbi:hypothetical protein [Methanobacterium aggregans]|uniref:hypothetical protein n=1 Tax=Methanobacterium aggregans TaxID=1615586 RepID=UPI001AEA5ABC|nr:hypothetical protein [Methanobacterium aggregans]MBP2046737.1 hypothetical protein [Methanobacterium aggregans]